MGGGGEDGGCLWGVAMLIGRAKVHVPTKQLKELTEDSKQNFKRLHSTFDQEEEQLGYDGAEDESPQKRAKGRRPSHSTPPTQTILDAN